MKEYIHTMRIHAKRTIVLLLAVLSVAIFSPATIVSALPQSQKDLFEKGVYYYDYNRSMVCSAVGVPAGDDAGANTDHAGNQILNESQFASIAENQPIYEEAATKHDLPWQLIAVLHLREHSLQRNNPSNGQGIYQLFSVYNSPDKERRENYREIASPNVQVTQANFLSQTLIAAEFIKSKASANLPENRQLTADSEAEVIKDTLFSYNGRSSQYAAQAAKLGYDEKTQPYEGSPYVMNRADAARDPDTAPNGTWGQIKQDKGPIEYPANSDYGGFVIYAAIAGISMSNNCSDSMNGTIRQKVVALAKQELDLWTEGQLKPGDYTKYTGGIHANWCAFFASWIYNQAGYPIHKSAQEGRVGAVQQIWDIGADSDPRFNYHSVSSGYTPRPGDMVIQKTNASHVNIVIAVNGSTITVIGGNQGGSGDMNGYYTRSSVTQYQMSINHANNTGFVSPD